MASLEGHLLVAAPHLLDPNFVRTVVLMVEHNEQGAWGLVLNRRTNTTVAEAWSQVSTEPCDCAQVLHHGGPCEGPLMVVHRRSDITGVEVLPGLFVTVDSDGVEQLIASEGEEICVFVGYAGWGAQQLEGELDTGSWLTAPAKEDHIFDPGDDLWGRVTKQIARAEALRGLNPKIVPRDPSMN